MRVTHVYKDYFPPVIGGIERHLHALCRGLVGAGVDVTAVVSNTRRSTEVEDIGGVRVTRAACLGRIASAPVSPGFVSSIRRLERETDLLHFHFPNPTGELAFMLSGCRTPYVVTYHADIVRQAPVMPIYAPILQRFLRGAARVILPTPRHLATSKFAATAAGRSAVIPYGVDPCVAHARGARERGDAWRRRLGEPLVLFVGRFRHYKGVDVLIEAARHVPASLAIVGDGPAGASLRRRAERNGSRATFLGSVSDADLWALYHACDVLALPSTNRAEGFGLVQLEAMSCGRPVVCTEVGTGTSFVNRHGETGLVVPPGDASALAVALDELVGNPELARRLGRQGRTRVEREFTEALMVRRTLDLYREVLDEVGARRVHRPLRASAASQGSRDAWA